MQQQQGWGGGAWGAEEEDLRRWTAVYMHAHMMKQCLPVSHFLNSVLVAGEHSAPSEEASCSCTRSANCCGVSSCISTSDSILSEGGRKERRGRVRQGLHMQNTLLKLISSHFATSLNNPFLGYRQTQVLSIFMHLNVLLQWCIHVPQFYDGEG